MNQACVINVGQNVKPMAEWAMQWLRGSTFSRTKLICNISPTHLLHQWKELFTKSKATEQGLQNMVTVSGELDLPT